MLLFDFHCTEALFVGDIQVEAYFILTKGIGSDIERGNAPSTILIHFMSPFIQNLATQINKQKQNLTLIDLNYANTRFVDMHKEVSNVIHIIYVEGTRDRQ